MNPNLIGHVIDGTVGAVAGQLLRMLPTVPRAIRRARAWLRNHAPVRIIIEFTPSAHPDKNE